MKAVVEVFNDKGYIWDAEVAKWLRLECGILGVMVGGIAAFKQQNALRGLPLELCAEEVTLVLEKGWGEVMAPLQTLELAQAGGGMKKRRRATYDYDQVEDYYTDDDDDDDEENSGDDEDQYQKDNPKWREALATGGTFSVPTKSTGSAALQSAALPPPPPPPPPPWMYPSTPHELHRYLVFRDLHSRGYRLTAGSKFGAHYMVYPGDISLYHAQFCVRLAAFDQPYLPAVFSGIARGSHQARKHLLLASVVERGRGEEWSGAESAGDDGLGKGLEIYYTSIGPVDGFG